MQINHLKSYYRGVDENDWPSEGEPRESQTELQDDGAQGLDSVFDDQDDVGSVGVTKKHRRAPTKYQDYEIF